MKYFQDQKFGQKNCNDQEIYKNVLGTIEM